MAKPWEAYAAPAQRPLTGAVDSLDEDGNVIATTQADPGLEVTVTDDSADAPPSEMAAQAPAPVAGQPWAEYGQPGEEGLTGSVTDETPWTDEPKQADEGPGTLESVWEGVKGGSLMGFGDEIQGVGGGIGSLISGRGFQSGYDAETKAARETSDSAWGNSPWAYGAGYVPGALMAMYLTRGRGAPAETLMGRLGQAAMEGGKQGALTGAGHGEGLGGTMMGTVGGGVGGAMLGPMLYPAGVVANNLIGRVGRALAPRGNAMNSGLDELAARAPQDGAAMRAAADEMAAANVPARLADVVDESGRGVVRAAASKMTPAREEVARHADDVYVSMQDRVAQQARRNISDNPQTSRQLADEVTAGRGDAMEAGMDPVRGQAVPLNDEVKAIFATREGMAALRGAEGLMTDPAEREVVRKLIGASKVHAKGVPEVDDVLRKEVPGWDDLPPAIKDAYLKQRPDLLEKQDPFANVTLTVDMADKIARAMKGRAAKTPGLERVATKFGDAIRNAAREASEVYAGAIDDYAARSGVANAASGEGKKFGATNFLSTPDDVYAANVARAAPNAPEGVAASEAEALRRRARDEVVDKATSGSGASAPGVARQLARGTAQQSRSTALLGEEGATNLRRGMEGEVRRLDNTRFIEPRSGSQTQGRGQDAIVDGFAEAAHSAASASNPWWGVIRTAGKWLKQGGIKGIDAERLARDSISEDPARVQAAIAYLEQKGMARARAQRFIAAFTGALGGKIAGTAAGD